VPKHYKSPASVSKVLLTGATGFVGKPLVTALAAQNVSVTCLVRNDDSPQQRGVNNINVGDLTTARGLEASLTGKDAVIHVAARAHIMNDVVSNPLVAFRRVNTHATLKLAHQAAEAGVKRFIFISSVKVNGESTPVNKPFKPDDTFVPIDPYGLSKYEAEQGLLSIARDTEMEVVIIRPPLIYGPGVRANFAAMLKWAYKGVPLPFGAIHNKRSLVALDNLLSFIILCIDHPRAANEVFMISDGEDVSTTELFRKVANAFSKKAVLLPVPVGWMTAAASLLGKKTVAARLFGSLQVDSSKARELLGWSPVTTMNEELKKTAEAYLNEKIV